MTMTTETLPDRLVMRGFDHSTAGLAFVVATGGLGMLALPLLLDFGWTFAAGGVGALAAVSFALTRLFRIRMEMTAERMEVRKSWAGITYSTRGTEVAPTTFSVRGGGWDEDDGPRYCEIDPAGTIASIRVGRPEDADELRRILNEQRDRLRSRAE